MPGKGRPFQAGNNANPHGRPRKTRAEKALEVAERQLIEDVAKAAKQDTDLALATLRGALLAENCPWSARITAAEAILNRGWGRAKETIAAEHKLTIEDLVLGAMKVEEERERAAAAVDMVTLSKPN
jgi:hypothetical protein